MKLISHRGNIKEPNPNRENSPSYIDSAISSGYEVEIDVRYIDGKFWLGHDTPDYEVTPQWLKMRCDKLWIHCKDLASASQFSDMIWKAFCHTNDPYVFTTNGYVWVHRLDVELTDRAIIPLLDEDDIRNYYGNPVYAVCTDYISLAEYELKQKGIYP